MLKDEEWESVLDNIQSENTIICLGAELFAQKGASFDQRLNDQLMGIDNVHMYADGLFHFKGSGDMTSFTKVKQFFKNGFEGMDALMAQLASIPITLYINANPDLHLCQAYDKLGFPYQYDFHYPKKPAKEIETPTTHNPLIYNLLGDIQHRESMVLTHEDLFGFLESVMEGKSISRVLKEKISAAYSLIFLGLPFNKWYMKVLLYFLQKDANRKALKFAANHGFDADVQAFMIEQFHITCVPTQIGPFVEELYLRCQKAGLKKESGKDLVSDPTERWFKFIQQDLLSDLLNDMVEYWQNRLPTDPFHLNHLLQLSGQLTHLELSFAKSTISNENMVLQRNKIRDALIEFLNDVERPIGQ